MASGMFVNDPGHDAGGRQLLESKPESAKDVRLPIALLLQCMVRGNGCDYRLSLLRSARVCPDGSVQSRMGRRQAGRRASALGHWFRTSAKRMVTS